MDSPSTIARPLSSHAYPLFLSHSEDRQGCALLDGSFFPGSVEICRISGDFIAGDRDSRDTYWTLTGRLPDTYLTLTAPVGRLRIEYGQAAERWCEEGVGRCHRGDCSTCVRVRQALVGLNRHLIGAGRVADCSRGSDGASCRGVGSRLRGNDGGGGASLRIPAFHPHPSPLPSRERGATARPLWVPAFAGTTEVEGPACGYRHFTLTPTLSRQGRGGYAKVSLRGNDGVYWVRARGQGRD